MDRELNPLTGDYSGATSTGLQNEVYIRLMTPLGAWWADPLLGSLLHTIEREKDVERVGMLARQYAEEALSPILKANRASDITVVETQPHNGWLYLSIQVLANTGDQFTYTHPVKLI